MRRSRAPKPIEGRWKRALDRPKLRQTPDGRSPDRMTQEVGRDPWTARLPDRSSSPGGRRAGRWRRAMSKDTEARHSLPLEGVKSGPRSGRKANDLAFRAMNARRVWWGRWRRVLHRPNERRVRGDDPTRLAALGTLPSRGRDGVAPRLPHTSGGTGAQDMRKGRARPRKKAYSNGISRDPATCLLVHATPEAAALSDARAWPRASSAPRVRRRAAPPCRRHCRPRP